MIRLCLALWAALLAASVTAWAESAADWPSRPVRVIVPIAAGSGIDIVARTVSQQLAKQLGRPFNLHLTTRAAGIGHCEIDWIERRRHWSDELRALLAVPDDLDIDEDVGLLDRIVPAEHRARYRAALTGSLDLTIEKDPVVTTVPGQAYYMVKGQTHGFTNKSSSPVQVIELFIKPDPASAPPAAGATAPAAAPPATAPAATTPAAPAATPPPPAK